MYALIEIEEAMNKLKGFTLLEVLVTLIILSIGLLGMASLQVQSLKYTQSGYQRTLASIQAQDLEERFWTRMADDPTTSSEYTNWKNDWKVDNAAGNDTMPGWDGQIETKDADNRIYRITISWTDPRFGNPPPFVYEFRLLKVFLL